MKKRQKLGLGGEAMFFSDPVNKYRKPQFADPGYGRGANSGFYKEIKKDPNIVQKILTPTALIETIGEYIQKPKNRKAQNID